MSERLINRSPDLKRLRDEGYDLEIRSGSLFVKDVPYVNATQQVCRGILQSPLQMNNDRTLKPENHVVHFNGFFPYDHLGNPLTQMINGVLPPAGAPLQTSLWMCSTKPACGYYVDYYEKMVSYINILSAPAMLRDETATPKTFPVYRATEEDSVFRYVDTASSRSHTSELSQRLAIEKIAIIGLGGTGSYILDFLAKTPAKELHLYDGDRFQQHNAFRAPGAPSGEELDKNLHKTDYYRGIYDNMRRGIISHPHYLTAETLEELRGMSFVFICMDTSEIKSRIVRFLESAGVDFIDVGMGLAVTANAISGILRVTTSTKENRGHVHGKQRISFADADPENEYASNIQVADLNALNAALAVIKWKKLCGYYLDLDREFHTTYTLDGNMVLNEDKA